MDSAAEGLYLVRFAFYPDVPDLLAGWLSRMRKNAFKAQIENADA